MEMMHKKAYVAWAAKQRNGGLDPNEAVQKWQELHDEADAITDVLGPTVKLAHRVAVKVKDLVVFRDKSTRSQINRYVGKETKKATQADVDAAEARLGKERTWVGSGALDPKEEAAQMGRSRAAAVAAGNLGAFSSAGRSASHIGNVLELVPEDEDKEAKTVGAGSDEPEKPTADTKGTEADSAGKQGIKKPWFNRDERILEALQKHKQWETAICTDLQTIKEVMENTKNTVTPEITPDVQAELRLLVNRWRAVKLVLATDTAANHIGSGTDATAAASAEAHKAPPVAADPGASEAAAAAAAAVETAAAAAGAAVAAAGSPEAPPATTEVAATLSGAKDAADAPGAIAATGDAPAAHVTAGPGASPQIRKPPPSEAPSTVNNYISIAGGVEKALRKFIASFSDGGEKSELGSQPPCRSYRSLKCLQEFKEVERKLKGARSKEEIVGINNSFKPFKAALADLMTMSKAANNRCEKAIGDAIKGLENKRKRHEDITESTRSKKRSKAAMASQGPLSFFDQMHALGLAAHRRKRDPNRSVPARASPKQTMRAANAGLFLAQKSRPFEPYEPFPLDDIGQTQYKRTHKLNANTMNAKCKRKRSKCSVCAQPRRWAPPSSP